MKITMTTDSFLQPLRDTVVSLLAHTHNAWLPHGMCFSLPILLKLLAYQNPWIFTLLILKIELCIFLGKTSWRKNLQSISLPVWIADSPYARLNVFFFFFFLELATSLFFLLSTWGYFLLQALLAFGSRQPFLRCVTFVTCSTVCFYLSALTTS